RPFDLTAFSSNDSTAGNKFAESFLATTLPEHESTQLLPSADPNARFYVTYYPGVINDVTRASAGLSTSVTSQQSVQQPVSVIQNFFDYLSTNAVNPEVFSTAAGDLGLSRYNPGFPFFSVIAQSLLPTSAEVHSYDDHWFLQTGRDTLSEWF